MGQRQARAAHRGDAHHGHVTGLAAGVAEVAADHTTGLGGARLGLGPEEGAGPRIDIGALAGQISDDEINAIRKAVARLHHPDLGGDPERMKAWNAALDRISR